MAFKAHILSTSSEVSIICAGIMDEHMDLPRLSLVPSVLVDLQQVSYINSIGVRKWIRWVQEIKSFNKVVLQNCPVIFVKSLTTIKGMITPNMAIESFYVPYYCDNTGERQNVLFRQGMEYFDDGRVSPPKLDLGEKNQFEIDVVEEIYFSFLKR